MLGCGASQESTVGVAKRAPSSSDDWPALSPWPSDAATVDQVVAAADGTQVQLRAYLAAVKLPCPACNVMPLQAPREGVTGRTGHPSGVAPPGCLPCPAAAATLIDENPRSPETSKTPRAKLRAVGLAAALQERHIGHAFFFIGVFHANGPDGPELDVTEVRALDGP